MADVARLPGLLEQIRLVAGLRWRILRNNLRKQSNVADLIGMFFVSLMGAILAFGVSAAVFVGTSLLLKNGKPEWLPAFFWGFFLWWQVSPILVTGFGGTFPFQTLLRFPLKQSAFYLIGLAYGLADSTGIAVLCWLASMTLAVALVKPLALPVMLAVVSLFILLNVALERLIGSWLEKVLAKRRIRELFIGLFILAMISLQFIGPVMQRYGGHAGGQASRIVAYARPLPPTLAGRAVASAVTGDSRNVLVQTGGLALYAIAIATLLWRRFATQYAGEELSESSAPGRAARERAVAPSGPEALAFLPTQVGAVIRKEFRYLIRNSFMFFSLLAPPMLMLLFATQFAGSHPTALKRGVSPELFFPGMMAYVVLILMAPAYNAFAYEGRGIQSYYLAPVAFRNILLGKNLFQSALVFGELLLCIVALGYLSGLPSAHTLLATAAALLFAVVGQFTIANWSSLTFPKRMEFGRMKGQRNSGMAVLIAFATQLVFGGACGAAFFAGRVLDNPWLPAGVLVFFAAAALVGYFASLDALSRYAEHQKEHLVDTLCR